MWKHKMRNSCTESDLPSPQWVAPSLGGICSFSSFQQNIRIFTGNSSCWCDFSWWYWILDIVFLLRLATRKDFLPQLAEFQGWLQSQCLGKTFCFFYECWKRLQKQTQVSQVTWEKQWIQGIQYANEILTGTKASLSAEVMLRMAGEGCECRATTPIVKCPHTETMQSAPSWSAASWHL